MFTSQNNTGCGRKKSTLSLHFLLNSYSIPCLGCLSSCSTCAGSPDFCLTCPRGQLASSGKCVSACPSDSFPSSDSCIKCHPDCSTCSGPSFNQCDTCPTSRPVLIGGRCLSTCSKSQYFDSSSSSCRGCDPSCSSCSGPGSRNCLGCGSSQVLRRGSCIPANCQDPNGVVPSLGVCMSELVQVPSPSGSVSMPFPTISGLAEPTTTTSPRFKPTWWHLFLMALGSVFILVLLLWFWRKRARRHREKKTKTFAREKNLDGVHGWFVRLGQRLFRNKRNDLPPELPVKYARDSLHSPRIQPIEQDMILRKLAPSNSEPRGRSAKRDSIDDLLSAYDHSVASRSTSCSSVDIGYRDECLGRSRSRVDRDSQSLYPASHRWIPDPRRFWQRDPITVNNSIGSSVFVPTLPLNPPMNRGVPVDFNYKTSSGGPNPINLIDAHACMQALRPTISREVGFTSHHQVTPHSIPIPTYAIAPAPNFSRPTGPKPSGTLPQIYGGNRLPLGALTDDRQGPYSQPRGPQPYSMTSGANGVSQTMYTGAPYFAISAHNPFRNRRH
jgi:hypothetical protein